MSGDASPDTVNRAAHGATSEGEPAKQVFFHIGAPKSGSTFVQEVLWENRAKLEAAGLCYPLTMSTGNLPATIDLCERTWGGRWNTTWDGSWDRMAETIRAASTPRAVFSGELMGLATPEQAARAVQSVQPAEVHLIFTSRDLARQLPSDWQEQVKHRHTVTLTKFVDDLVRLGMNAPKPFGELFWGLHDAAYVLARWEHVVPAERIHVVTVPPPGAPPGLLWSRLAGLLGVDPAEYDLTVSRDNTSMGLIETEFLRRFNAATRTQLKSEHGPIVHRTLGQEILAAGTRSRPIRLPRRHYDWVVRRSQEMVDAIAGRGYDVVGDLAELIPGPPFDGDEIVPEKLPPMAVNQVAYHTVAELVDEILALRGRSRRLAQRLEEHAPGALDEAGSWRTESGDVENAGGVGWSSTRPAPPAAAAEPVSSATALASDSPASTDPDDTAPAPAAAPEPVEQLA